MRAVLPVVVTLLCVSLFGCHLLQKRYSLTDAPFGLTVELQPIPDDDDRKVVEAFLDHQGFEKGYGNRWSKTSLNWADVQRLHIGLASQCTQEGVPILVLVKSWGIAHLSYASASSSGTARGLFNIEIDIKPVDAKMYLETDIPGQPSGPYKGRFSCTLDLGNPEHLSFVKNTTDVYYRVVHEGMVWHYRLNLENRKTQLLPLEKTK